MAGGTDQSEVSQRRQPAALSPRARRGRHERLAWNVLGLLDLTDAFGLGFLTAPSRFALEIQPTSDLMTVLPLVLITVYLVPLFFVLRLASLAKLRRETGASQSRGKVADVRHP
jgi:hypothetical protein